MRKDRGEFRPRCLTRLRHEVVRKVFHQDRSRRTIESTIIKQPNNEKVMQVVANEKCRSILGNAAGTGYRIVIVSFMMPPYIPGSITGQQNQMYIVTSSLWPAIDGKSVLSVKSI